MEVNASQTLEKPVHSKEQASDQTLDASQFRDGFHSILPQKIMIDNKPFEYK